LAKRLAELQEQGLIERVASVPGDPEPGRRGTYRLTDRGRALEPALMELGRWGAHQLPTRPDPRDRFDLGWALISSKRRYSRAANRPRLTLELGAHQLRGPAKRARTQAGGRVRAESEQREVQRRFALRCDPGYVDVREGTPWPADVVLDGSLDAVLQLWMLGVPATELLRRGQLSLVGEPELLADILSSFSGIRWE